MLRGVCLALVLALLAACAPTRQPRGEVTTSGFLRDYSMLEAGKDGEANPQMKSTDLDGL